MARDNVPTNPTELVNAIRTFVTALDNTEGQNASGLKPPQFAQLDTLSSNVVTRLATVAQCEAALRAAREALADDKAAALAEFRALRRQASNYVDMTDELRGAAGLPVREPPKKGALPVITDLRVQPKASGSNALDWTGLSGGALRYEVFARLLSEGTWTLVGASSSTSFVHKNAGAGVGRIYRVVPCRGKRRGEPSNEAAAYAG